MGAIGAIILGVIAWLSLVGGLFFSADPFLFLGLGLVCGAVALFLAVQARHEAGDAALGAAGVGAAALYGAAVAAMLVATVYATGILLLIVLLLLLALAGGASVTCASSGSSAPPPEPCCCEDCCDECTCEGCCDGCCADCCGAGACGCGDCGCGDCGCGGCGGCGCGGCGCATFVLAPSASRLGPPVAPMGWRDRFAHHPDTPEFREDVFRLRGARLCIGCFVTYPVFFAVTALLLVLPLPFPWHTSLLVGLGAACAQALSSAGLAKRWWMKTSVKTLLGAGLALYVAGVRAAPWPPVAKALALGVALALALASTIPRRQRMRRARAKPCACNAPRAGGTA